MSTQATTSFLEALGSDGTLANELWRRMAEREGDGALEAFVEFAGDRGFEVTADDAAAVRDAVRLEARAEGELDDSQLDEVAGGADIFGDLIGGIGGLPASLKKEFWPF